MKRLLSALLLMSGVALGQAQEWSLGAIEWGSGVTASALRSATTNVDVSAATAPSNGQVLTATSSSTATWQALAVGSPVGSDTEVQFNDGGALAGAAGLTYGKAAKSVSGTGPWTLTPTADITPLTVRAYSSGTSAIFQWQTAANGALGNISHDGAITAPSITLTTGAAAGSVLTSDAGGAATWQAPHSMAYGGLYENSVGSAITVTTAGTYYGWKSATAGTLSGAGYVTADVANVTADNLTIGASGAGVYFVTLNVSYSNNQDNRTVEGAIFKGSTEQLNIEWKRKAAVGADLGSVSASGFLTLAAGDTISFRLTSSTNGDIVTVRVVNLTIHRIG